MQRITDTDAVQWRCVSTVSRLTVPEYGLNSGQREELHALDVVQRRPGMEGAGQHQAALLRELGVEPDVTTIEGNLAVYGGISCVWECLIGNGTTTSGQALTFFSNARAALGVGDSTTAVVATHTDLQASTNKVRVGMDASYPAHTDGTTSGAITVTFSATFGTSVANWAWAEWGIFNSSSAGTGRMLNRKVESFGTKVSTQVWQLQQTLTLS